MATSVIIIAINPIVFRIELTDGIAWFLIDVEFPEKTEVVLGSLRPIRMLSFLLKERCASTQKAGSLKPEARCCFCLNTRQVQ